MCIYSSQACIYLSAAMVAFQMCKLSSPWALIHHHARQAFEVSADNKVDGPSSLYSGGRGIHAIQEEFQNSNYLTADTVLTDDDLWKIPLAHSVISITESYHSIDNAVPRDGWKIMSIKCSFPAVYVHKEMSPDSLNLFSLLCTVHI